MIEDIEVVKELTLEEKYDQLRAEMDALLEVLMTIKGESKGTATRIDDKLGGAYRDMLRRKNLTG